MLNMTVRKPLGQDQLNEICKEMNDIIACGWRVHFEGKYGDDESPIYVYYFNPEPESKAHFDPDWYNCVDLLRGIEMGVNF